jgi:hypothetical protein
MVAQPIPVASRKAQDVFIGLARYFLRGSSAGLPYLIAAGPTTELAQPLPRSSSRQNAIDWRARWGAKREAISQTQCCHRERECLSHCVARSSGRNSKCIVSK